MKKIKFNIGNQPRITINLPSKKRGDGSILAGRATAYLGSLQSSVKLEIQEFELLRFSSELITMDNTLKGRTQLYSCSSDFKLEMSMTLRGHVEVQYNMKTSQFTQPNDINWTASGSFTFEPSLIRDIAVLFAN